ncbi:MAG: NnrS family protein [Cognatishimia sp.]
MNLRNFWAAPHRPLFLAAFLCALITVGYWPLFTWSGPSEQLPGVLWHVHELIFGFAGAAIGGYTLTALPSWTSQPPLRGLILMGITSVWALARLATFQADAISPLILVSANAGYFAILALILGQQILSARAYRKLGFALVCAFMAVMDILFLSASVLGTPWISLELARIIVFGITLLMISVGTHAIPAFTRNWMAGIGISSHGRRSGVTSRALTQGLLGGVILGTLTGQHALASIAMIGAALTLLWHMRGWQCLSALHNPLLAALHLAFLWVPIGLLALGVIGLNPSFYPAADAMHAITIGGISGLIMAIAGRAAAHTETGPLKATRGFVIGVVLNWLATWCRLAVPVFPNVTNELLQLAALVWCLGWVAFIVGFSPALIGAPRRPVLSGQRNTMPIARTHKNRSKV